MKTIGLMSGTSVDGVDAVMLELEDVDRRHVPVVLGHAYLPFNESLRRELSRPETLPLPRISALHYELPHLYAQVVRTLEGWQDAACVGMHGQTVWHAPPSVTRERPHTLQIGNTSVLAQLLGLPVVGDLRAADLALGGEGAPIIPMCHWMFTPAETAVVVNLGGIANYTFVAPRLEDVTASDIGPGMMITDAFARHASGGRLDLDRDGELSHGGIPCRELVDRILGNPFFRRPSPRTTGREDFGEAFARTLLHEFGKLSGADLLASSLQATAEAIAGVLATDIPPVHRMILSGGGARHPGLRQRIAAAVAPCPVEVMSAGPLAPEHHEAAGMALIAARTMARLPSSLPKVTGARRPAILGHVCWP